MLSITGQPRKTCEGLTRREILTAGGAGLLGLTVPKLLQAEDLENAINGSKAKSVIFLFLFGGPSQFETFDMKPEAPSEIRGPFQHIDSRTPGLRISEHLPKLANISDKFTVIRTMNHTFNDHSGGGFYVQTGHRWHVKQGGGFNATPQDWPSMGSVVEYLTQQIPGGMDKPLPSYAVLPNRLGRLQENGQYIRPGEYAGWLGQSYNPLTTKINKRNEKDNPYWRECTDKELSFAIQGLSPEIPIDTIRRRVSLLNQFEEHKQIVLEKSDSVRDKFRKRAMALITSDDTRSALNIQKESGKTRDLYGRHLFGQSCLMARRMVEAGVRFVTVHYDCVDGYSWDSHQNSKDVQHNLLPTFDQGLSGLLADLEERGMLDETLVVAMGEMGRTPIGNKNWGRGHWSTLFPAVLAGAGIQGGTTYGESDRKGTRVINQPVSPEDLAATIYWSLGINPHMMIKDNFGRPVPLVEGNPVKALFS